MDLFTDAHNAEQNNDPLASESARAEFIEDLSYDINQWCIKEYRDEHRTHLGASVLGRPCIRQLWGIFRWIYNPILTGREYRLLNRGNREEPEIIKILRGVGMDVQDVDANTGKQFRIKACNGHMGGSLDSKIGLLKWRGIDVVVLGEYKTAGQQPFIRLVSKGMRSEKPEHYDQMCLYGRDAGYKYGIYIAVSKNNDEWHMELVPLDWIRAEALEEKAREIIKRDTVPQRLHENPSQRDCKMCDLAAVCHQGAPVDKNCRSCTYSKPVDDGQWLCTGYNQVIPDDVIKVGCDNHNPFDWRA